MGLLDTIRTKAYEQHMSLTDVTKLYNVTYNTTITRQSMHKRLKDETVKYRDYERILAVLGYDITLQNRV